MSQQPRRSHAPAPAPARGQPARSAQDKENDQVHHDASDRLSRSGNENPGPRASTKTHSQGHHANTAATSNDDDEDDNDGDQARPGELHGDHDGDSDGESPVRPRVRRMSAKQIQLAEEVEAAEARKAAKVTQAAKTAVEIRARRVN
ncbi:hypothetical protein B0H19DRAFT_1272791 [Mycena capillaripes]|nr:hypothetical protein B0H19DRAFT_1272791 [Mycena capillaripes]